MIKAFLTHQSFEKKKKTPIKKKGKMPIPYKKEYVALLALGDNFFNQICHINHL